MDLGIDLAGIMETANKGTPATNKATMGNNTSGRGNDNNKTMDTKSTPAKITVSSSSDNKIRNANSEKPNKPQLQTTQALEQQACAKNETKEAIKTPTVNDQTKIQKSRPVTTINLKATSAVTTTPTTTTSTTNKPSTTTSGSAAASTDAKNSVSSSVPIESKDDIKPPPANTEDKSSSSKQPENSAKNRNFISAAPACTSGGEDNLKPATDSFGASVHQQYQKQNKPLHNSFQNQHHSNNSQGNPQQPQQSQQQQQQQQNLHQPNNSNQYHSHFQQQHQHQGNDEQLSKTNLYIRGLNADTSDSDLYTLCNRFGSIVSTKAILDKSTNKCKGYGFVDFDNPASAEMAVTELQKQGILVHMAKQQEADPTNLYLANLPTTMTESDLENLLRPYGQVVSTRILINQHRQPRGVGFARMETKEQCDSIIALLNGQVIKGSKEPLLVKFADGANKKRPHHFQHKPLGGNLFVGNHMRRNNGNDTNHYHMMNSGGGGSRNFHGGSFSEHPRQNHALTHHDNGLIKHQQMLTSMPGYHPHHQGGGHPSYIMQQPQMMGPTSAIDPSMHYVNIANQMQGLQIGNHPVSGYMSPQQWPAVWPPGGSSAFSSNSNTSRDTILR